MYYPTWLWACSWVDKLPDMTSFDYPSHWSRNSRTFLKFLFKLTIFWLRIPFIKRGHSLMALSSRIVRGNHNCCKSGIEWNTFSWRCPLWRIQITLFSACLSWAHVQKLPALMSSTACLPALPPVKKLHALIRLFPKVDSWLTGCLRGMNACTYHAAVEELW